MGHGIAQVHAAIGKHVALYEPDLARAEAGKARIADNLARAVAKGRLDGRRTDGDPRADRADGVARRASPTPTSSIEAVFEDVDVKTALWRDLDARAPGRSDLRDEHVVDLDRSARRGGRRGAAAAGSSGCTSSAPCR